MEGFPNVGRSLKSQSNAQTLYTFFPQKRTLPNQFEGAMESLESNLKPHYENHDIHMHNLASFTSQFASSQKQSFRESNFYRGSRLENREELSSSLSTQNYRTSEYFNCSLATSPGQFRPRTHTTGQLYQLHRQRNQLESWNGVGDGDLWQPRRPQVLEGLRLNWDDKNSRLEMNEFQRRGPVSVDSGVVSFDDRDSSSITMKTSLESRGVNDDPLAWNESIAERLRLVDRRRLSQHQLSIPGQSRMDERESYRVTRDRNEMYRNRRSMSAFPTSIPTVDSPPSELPSANHKSVNSNQSAVITKTF